MIHVIPAILEHDWNAVQKKAKIISTFTNEAQLDVMDGVFVPNTTYANPRDIATLPLNIEAHLMIMHPEIHVMAWNLPNVFRILFHYEAAQNPRLIIDMVKKMGKEVGIAINPETPVRALAEYMDDINTVMVMGVPPGFSGQKFQYDALEKIKEIKRDYPHVIVEVDGGVNQYTAKHIVAAGGDVIAALSAIFSAEDPKAMYNTLQNTEPAPPRHP